MDKDALPKHIMEAITQVLGEGWYDYSPHPTFSRSETQRELGRNPLYTDNGNHASADRITQPSTIDFNGMGFRGQNYVISDNAATIYKIKNFGHDRHTGTMNMFANTKDFRTALDLLCGGAKRGGRSVMFRSFTPQSKATTAKRNGYMSYTFWEFSLDGGQTWNIMRPNPLDKLQPSKMVVKKEEPKTPETAPESPSVETENINRNMSKKIQMKRSDLARYIGESVRKVLREMNETPQGKQMLNNLQAKMQKGQGSETCGDNRPKDFCHPFCNEVPMKMKRSGQLRNESFAPTANVNLTIGLNIPCSSEDAAILNGSDTDEQTRISVLRKYLSRNNIAQSEISYAYIYNQETSDEMNVDGLTINDLVN